jgi:signal transduction histidine kinase
VPDAPAEEKQRVLELEAFAAEALRTARDVERVCAEIERTTGVGLLDELGVRSVRERAEHAAETARALIERAVDGPAPCRPVDVSECVRGALRALRAARPARVQMDVLLRPDLPLAWGRPDALAEALETLGSTGLQAVEDSWGTLSVTTGVTVPGRPLVSGVYHSSFAGTLHDESPRCFVEVHDTGPSIPPEAWRGRPRSVLGGADAGRVAALVELRARLAASGAELDVHSTPGCGTRVLLLLPIAHV